TAVSHSLHITWSSSVNAITSPDVASSPVLIANDFPNRFSHRERPRPCDSSTRRAMTCGVSSEHSLSMIVPAKSNSGSVLASRTLRTQRSSIVARLWVAISTSIIIEISRQSYIHQVTRSSTKGKEKGRQFLFFPLGAASCGLVDEISFFLRSI